MITREYKLDKAQVKALIAHHQEQAEKFIEYKFESSAISELESVIYFKEEYDRLCELEKEVAED